MSLRTGFGRVRLFEDFLDIAITSHWNSLTENSGTSASLDDTEDGELDLITGTTSGNRSGITKQRNWRAESGGPLIFEAGVKCVTAITLRALFIGWTDLETIENPIEASGTGDGLTTTADDAVGFMYDTLADTDVWFATGVDSTVDAAGSGALAARFTERTPVADTYQAFRIVVNEDGRATFYIDGRMVNRGSDISGWDHNEILRGAVSPDVSLTPVVLTETRSNAAVTVRVDYIYCEKGRNP